MDSYKKNWREGVEVEVEVEVEEEAEEEEKEEEEEVNGGQEVLWWVYTGTCILSMHLGRLPCANSQINSKL